MLRMILIMCVVLVVAVSAAALWFRHVPMTPAVWHVEPAMVTPPRRPNFVLRIGPDAPVFAESPAIIAARLSRVAREDRASVIAGSPETGHVTYVLRSTLMGFPDAVSIQILPQASGTKVEIFSRSRYGYSDLGVNAARVAAWIAALGAQRGP